MASTSGGRRRPQKYPDELCERAVRMVQEIRRESGESHGVITRVARELGVGAESLRGWVNVAEIDSGKRPGTSTVDAQRIAQFERENKERRQVPSGTGLVPAGGEMQASAIELGLQTMRTLAQHLGVA